MHLPVLLWICLKLHSSAVALGAGLSTLGRVHRCSSQDNISAMIKDVRPDALCFDYDYPSAEDLDLLRDTKRRYPSLPILMFSEENSTELAIWALRTRVWDYFIKPVEMKEVRARLSMLARIAELQPGRRGREVFMPVTSISDASVRTMTVGPPMPTQAAIHYATGHLHERIPLTTVAGLCGMGTYEFSRSFRREQGITFRDFLIQLRVHEAARLLRNSKTTVLEVACTVGFNDPSHFARMFRRHFGVTPTVYRSRNRPYRGINPSNLAGLTVPPQSILPS